MIGVIKRISLVVVPALIMSMFIAFPASASTAHTCTRGASIGPFKDPSISQSYGNNETNIIQDEWNISGYPFASQCITGWGPSYWWIHATMPSGNKAVISYPDAQQIFTASNGQNPPISKFGWIYSSYSESNPSAGDWESAYDIWLDGSGSRHEVMIWTYNHGQTPAGSYSGTLSSYGQDFGVYLSSGTISLVAANRNSNTVHILDIFRHLSTKGLVNLNTEDVSQVDYGWELCSTNGSPEYFTVTGYSLTSSPIIH